MNNLKDFEKARRTLEVQSKRDHQDIQIDAYKKRERTTFKGINEFLKSSSSRSELFRVIAKGTLIAGGAFVLASVGLDLIAGQASQVAQSASNVTPNLTAAAESVSSLLNTGMTLLGGGGAAHLAKRASDGNIAKAEGIRDDIMSFRQDMESNALGIKPKI